MTLKEVNNQLQAEFVTQHKFEELPDGLTKNAQIKKFRGTRYRFEITFETIKHLYKAIQHLADEGYAMKIDHNDSTYSTEALTIFKLTPEQNKLSKSCYDKRDNPTGSK